MISKKATKTIMQAGVGRIGQSGNLEMGGSGTCADFHRWVGKMGAGSGRGRGVATVLMGGREPHTSHPPPAKPLTVLSFKR